MGFMINIELLEQQRRILQERISKLQASGVDTTFLETRVKELDQIIEKAEAEKRVEEDRARVEARKLEASLKNDISALNDTLDALKKQEQAVDLKIGELSKALENVKGAIAANENKLKELHGKVDHVAKDMMVTNDMQAENAEKISKKEETLKELKEPGNILREKSRKLREELKTLDPNSEEYKAKAAELEKVSAERRKINGLDKADEPGEKPKSNLEKAREKREADGISQEAKDLRRLKAEKESLSIREAALEAQHSELLNQIQSTENNIEQLRAQKNAIEAQIEKLKEEKKALVEQQKQLEEIKAQKEKELEKVQGKDKTGSGPQPSNGNPAPDRDTSKKSPNATGHTPPGIPTEVAAALHNSGAIAGMAVGIGGETGNGKNPPALSPVQLASPSTLHTDRLRRSSEKGQATPTFKA